MHNIFAIFKTDLEHLITNMVAAIVAIGLVLVPPMYAWLTELGFWNPYNNTGNVSIAVADNDEGYSSALIPSRINAGSQIVEALHENDQFDWQFMDSESAIDSVRSGKSYAAIVIPSDFSKRLMTAFSSTSEKPEIDYYENEKTNAIASHVTETGMNDLHEQVNATFTKTVTDIALSTTSSLSEFLTGDGLINYAAMLMHQLNVSLDDLNRLADGIDSIDALVQTSKSLVSTNVKSLGQSASITNDTKDMLNDAASAISNGSDAAEGIVSETDSAINDASSSLKEIEEAINTAFDAVETDPDDASVLLSDLATDTEGAIATYESIKSSLESIGAPQSSIDSIDSIIASLNRLKDALNSAASDISSSKTTLNESRQKIEKYLNEAQASIQGLQGNLDEQIESNIESLSTELESIQTSASSIGQYLEDAAKSVGDAADDLEGGLNKMHVSLLQAYDALTNASSLLEKTKDQLNAAIESNNMEEIRKIIGSHPDALASFLTTPATLERHAVFPINDNGSSMSPFYTSLSLWIGSIFLVALTSTNVSKRQLKTLKDPKPWQLYLGRYLVFGMLAIMQAIVVCIGNVFIVGIQCEHFWLYLLTCIVCGIVFSNFIFTLVVSFGNIGKALAIVLLVMQLAGSGGIMPIQMSAPIFQAIYPWLPLTHSMAAMQGCIAGFYGAQFWVPIACLLAFLIPSLLLGFVLRKPMIKALDYVNMKLEETKIL